MKKKIYRIFMIGFLLLFSLFTITTVRADSGWDTDYDSGGWSSSDWSSSSSSDWSSSDWSSSDWSSSSSSSHHSSSSSSSSSNFYTFIFLLIMVIIFLYAIHCGKKTNSTGSTTFMKTKSDLFMDVANETVEELLPGYTLNSLKKELFDKFIDIQMAWMNFDYDMLRKLCTDELYNSYLAQLEVLKAKNGKNIMEYFENVASKITSIHEENGLITIQVFMAVSFYDYVINTTTNSVTRGNKNRKILNNYQMTFVISPSSSIDKCPSCGAPIKEGSSTTCAYCDSTIVKKSNDFVLSKKTNINN